MRLRYPHLPVALLLLMLLTTLLSSVGFTATQAQTLPAGTGSGSGHGAPQRAASLTAATFPATMSENFESAWPSSGWALYDLSGADGGEYLWGRRNCNPHSGGYSGWSVGGGAQGSPRPCFDANYLYPNNILTQAVYGPFDLSDATSAIVTYYIWGSTEWDGTDACPYDRFTIQGYTDANAYDYNYYCGNWTQGSDGNGYFKRTLNLSHMLGPGQGNAWLKLEFSSDSSAGDIGMFIDDITLAVVRPTPTPTDTPTTTPTGTPTNTPTSTQTGAPTGTPTNTPTNTPTSIVGPAPPRPFYLPLTLRAPQQTPTPSLPPTLSCPDDIEPNNIPEDGKRLTTINSSCHGSFQNEQVPIFDYYWIQPSIGQQIVVDLTGIPSGANYDIALYRQDPANVYTRVSLSNKPGQTPEHFEYRVDSNKRYYLRVSLIQKSPSAKDTYTLGVAIN
jgi:hypothetical protein